MFLMEIYRKFFCRSHAKIVKGLTKMVKNLDAHEKAMAERYAKLQIKAEAAVVESKAAGNTAAKLKELTGIY